MASQPNIVNITPPQESENIGVIEPIRFSVRDMDTHIDPTTINIGVGYASIFSKGDKLFDDALSRTSLSSIFVDPPEGTPNITITDDGVRIEKTLSAVQKSVYVTAIDAPGPGIKSAMIAAVLNPEIQLPASEGDGGIDGPLGPSVIPGVFPVPYFSPLPTTVIPFGAVLGLEHGPRNTAVYAFFVNIGTELNPERVIRITGPSVNGTRTPDIIVEYDWQGFQRYFLVWDEVTTRIYLYAAKNPFNLAIKETVLIASMLFNTFPPFDELINKRNGGVADVVGLYGQEGEIGNTVVIRSVAVTTDVGFPITGQLFIDNFKTFRQGSEVVRFKEGEDPRKLVVAPWFDAPTSHFPMQSTEVIKKVSTGIFEIIKIDPFGVAAIFREEPSFDRLGTNTDGLLLELKFFGLPSMRIGAGTGMGFIVYDGQTVFEFDMFDDFAHRTVGLLKREGSSFKVIDHIMPPTPISWSSPITVRIIADPRRNKFEIFILPDLSLPIFSEDLDAIREQLPTGVDKGFDGKLPFIAFGHIASGQTAGRFDIHRLTYSGIYQTWESLDDIKPTSANPIYTKTITGTPTDEIFDENLVVTCENGETLKYSRNADFSPDRGYVVECSAAVDEFKPLSSVGSYIVLDDGEHLYMLTFVDTVKEKFISIPIFDVFDPLGFTEVVGLDSFAKKVSFPLNWDTFHTYRIERRPKDGLYVFVDNEPKPRLFISDKDAEVKFPTTLSPDNPKLTFGQLRDSGSTTRWKYVRAMSGSGYEISFIKNKTNKQLRKDLFGKEALVVANLHDVD